MLGGPSVHVIGGATSSTPTPTPAPIPNALYVGVLATYTGLKSLVGKVAQLTTETTIPVAMGHIARYHLAATPEYCELALGNGVFYGTGSTTNPITPPTGAGALGTFPTFRAGKWRIRFQAKSYTPTTPSAAVTVGVGSTKVQICHWLTTVFTVVHTVNFTPPAGTKITSSKYSTFTFTSITQPAFTVAQFTYMDLSISTRGGTVYVFVPVGGTRCAIVPP